MTSDRPPDPGPRSTPLDRLMSLDIRKRRAFLALFAGARRETLGSRLPDGSEISPSFGNAECDWIDDWRDFYGRELPALGLLTFHEGEPRPAFGMLPGSVVWDIRIGITDDGRAARETWWAERDRKAQEREVERA